MMPPRHGSVDVVVALQVEVGRLRPCLESVRQELPASATITIVDAIRDETAEPAKRHEEIALVARALNLPIVRQPRSPWEGRNRAAERGSAPLILFLDGDCVLAKGIWAGAAAAMERESVGVLGGMVLWAEGHTPPQVAVGTIKHAGYVFGPRLMPYSRFQSWAPDNPKVYRRDDLQAVGVCCMLTRRSAFRTLHGFDPDRHFGHLCFADVDYCLRARAHGMEVEFDPHFLVVGATEPLSLNVQELKQGAATLQGLAGHITRFDEYAVL